MQQREHLAVVTVATEAFHTAPTSVAVTLRRPLFRCWPSLTRSHRVATFVFEEQQHSSSGTTYTSLASSVNTLLLERYYRQQDTTAQVKITVLGRGNEKLKALFDLDAFMDDLTTIGLVQMGRELILRLLDTEEHETQRQDDFQDEGEQEEVITVQASTLLPSTETEGTAILTPDETQEQGSNKKKKRRRRTRRRKRKSQANTQSPQCSKG